MHLPLVYSFSIELFSKSGERIHIYFWIYGCGSPTPNKLSALPAQFFFSFKIWVTSARIPVWPDLWQLTSLIWAPDERILWPKRLKAKDKKPQFKPLEFGTAPHLAGFLCSYLSLAFYLVVYHWSENCYLTSPSLLCYLLERLDSKNFFVGKNTFYALPFYVAATLVLWPVQYCTKFP